MAFALEEKEKILEILGNKELPSTTIYKRVGKGYWRIVMLLEDLEREKKVRKIQKGGWTYWRKNGKGGLEKNN